MADRDVHLPNLARELHSTRQLTPMQIRNRTGFLDANERPYIPLETIQNWLTGADTPAPLARQATPSSPLVPPQEVKLPVVSLDPTGRDTSGQYIRQSVDDSRALHAKVAHLEAQLRRLSFEARRTPSPARSPRASPGRSGRSSPASPLLEERDNNREMIDQLKQMNTQLMAQLAAANQLVTAALGAMDRRDPVPPVSPVAAKPFRDWLPQVEAYAGEAHRAPEAFLAQFYLYARQNNVPASERARQLIGKLTGPAQTWYTLTFATDPAAATESQIALGLRKAFGQEYAGARALRAMYQVTAQPTQSGAQRLLALDQREEQARQHRVPRDAGPFETRFSRVLALFLPEELNPFLGELTADSRCSEEALRQLEETSDLRAAPDAAGRTSLAPTSPAREALFAIRVQLAEAALRRLQAPSAGPARARLARADGAAEPHHDYSAGTRHAPPPVAPTPAAASPPAGTSDEYVARCCRLTAEHTVQAAGTGFVGPPHYFGDNKDEARKAKNQAELKRRRAAGYCFKCRVADVKDLPFLECPLHGALASDPSPPTVGRTLAAPAPKRG